MVGEPPGPSVSPPPALVSGVDSHLGYRVPRASYRDQAILFATAASFCAVVRGATS